MPEIFITENITSIRNIVKVYSAMFVGFKVSLKVLAKCCVKIPMGAFVKISIDIYIPFCLNTCYKAIILNMPAMISLNLACYMYNFCVSTNDCVML